MVIAVAAGAIGHAPIAQRSCEAVEAPTEIRDDTGRELMHLRQLHGFMASGACGTGDLKYRRRRRWLGRARDGVPAVAVDTRATVRRPARGGDRVDASAVLDAGLEVTGRARGCDTRRGDRGPRPVRTGDAVSGVTTDARRGVQIPVLIQLEPMDALAVRAERRCMTRATLRRHIGRKGSGQGIAPRQYFMTAVAGNAGRGGSVSSVERDGMTIRRSPLRLRCMTLRTSGNGIGTDSHHAAHLAVTTAAAECPMHAARQGVGSRDLVPAAHAHLLSGSGSDRHREYPRGNSEPSGQAD